MQMEMRARLRIGLLAIGLGACALGAACGGDDDDDKGDASMAEACFQVGQVENPCLCSTEQPPGYRTCKADFTWGMCQCPPGLGMTDCKNVGDSVTCPTKCPGEATARTTKCLQGGTFDCSCSM